MIPARGRLDDGSLDAEVLAGLPGAVVGVSAEPGPGPGSVGAGRRPRRHECAHRYELTDNGVRAFFGDGTHADGDILVGADGSNSRLRRQRLPDLRRQELGIVNIAGRVPLAGDVATTLPAELTDGGINNIVPDRTGWMFVSTWATGDPDNTDVSDGAARYLIWAWARRA